MVSAASPFKHWLPIIKQAGSGDVKYSLTYYTGKGVHSRFSGHEDYANITGNVPEVTSERTAMRIHVGHTFLKKLPRIYAIVGIILFLEISSSFILNHLVNPERIERFDLIYGADTNRRFIPHPFLGYVSYHYFSEAQRLVDSLHENRTGRVYVVAMGGSTTEDGWPEITQGYLQRKLVESNFTLEVEVFNFGVGGWPTPISIQNYFYLIRYLHPDFVVIHENVNDMSIEQFLEKTAIIDYPEVSHLEKNLIQLSSFYKLLKITYLSAYNSLFSTTLSTGPVAVDVSETARMSAFMNQQYGYRLRGDQTEFFWVRSEPITYLPANGKPHFILKENYEALIRYTRADNSTLILTTQYLNFSKPNQPCWKEGDCGVGERNQLIRDLSEEYNLPLVDLDVGMTPYDHFLKDDAAHFLQEGIRIKGELVGATIFKILAERYNLTR